MLKISDILKKTKKKGEDKSSHSAKKTAAREVQEASVQANKNAEEIRKEDLVKPQDKGKSPPSISTVTAIQFKNSDNKEAVNVYKEAISLSEQMGGLSSQNWESFYKSAKRIIDIFINILGSDENALLRLFFSDYYSSQGYLYQHSVNTCILSLYISISIKYSREQLHQVGLAALLHDIGLIQYDNLISQNKRFGKNEYNEIRQHPIAGRKIIENISSNMDIEILEVISQEHERLDGSGYPHALKEEEISEKARLIGLVDSYESMMHIRPYRDKFKSEEVIKFLTQQKVRFEYKFIKALIDLIGVFPIMTSVKLNTRETGVVIKQNFQMPLKPVVNITHSAQGQKTDTPKAIDLASNFSIYIQEGFISHKTKDEKNSE
ncbi:MAG: HD domain-containing phosphohydrolase [Candidatus Omnitrophota bacterium]